MNIEQSIQFNPELLKITESTLEEALRDKFDIEFDRNKTWGEMGIQDDLDQIELVMEIEKILNIQILDDVISVIFNTYNKPIDFLQILRDKKLDDLGI